LLDALEVTASGEPDKSIYNVSAELVDKRATDRTKRLMQYLVDMYGKYIISGQYGNKGLKGNEFTAINTLTGKYPAILGLDFIEYTPSRVAHGSTSKDVEYAIEFDKEGGIVTFCWHWNAPEKYLINSSTAPWWKGFYKEGTNIDLKKIMDGEDPEGYDLLIQDIDAIAVQLKRLQEADIPILGVRFMKQAWMVLVGNCRSRGLHQALSAAFDRLTNYHDIHNLIWVWNGQHQDWYPGDAYVDIVGTDIYPGKGFTQPKPPVRRAGGMERHQ
jgi:mannan endo-1,4-beta-mannosidase